MIVQLLIDRWVTIWGLLEQGGIDGSADESRHSVLSQVPLSVVEPVVVIILRHGPSCVEVLGSIPFLGFVQFVLLLDLRVEEACHQMGWQDGPH